MISRDEESAGGKLQICVGESSPINNQALRSRANRDALQFLSSINSSENLRRQRESFRNVERRTRELAERRKPGGTRRIIFER